MSIRPEPDDPHHQKMVPMIGFLKGRGSSALGSDRRNQGPKGLGGAYRDRTDDPLLAKQVLSQLS